MNIRAFLVSIILFSIFIFFQISPKDEKKLLEEKHIVVVVPSYNNKKWYKKNLDSFFNQNYKNCEMIYIDDFSPDDTGNLVEKYVKENEKENKVRVIKNKERLYRLANLYKTIYI